MSLFAGKLERREAQRRFRCRVCNRWHQPGDQGVFLDNVVNRDATQPFCLDCASIMCYLSITRPETD